MLTKQQADGLEQVLSDLEQNRGEDNSELRKRMKVFVSVAMNHGLTPKQKELMRLIYMEELPQKEAAKRMNMSPSAASGIKRRALRRVRNLARYMI